MLRDKVTWEMSTFEMSSPESKDKQQKLEVKWQSNMGNNNIQNVKSRGGKDKQRKFQVQLSKSQGFKVSNLRWQSNMGNINIQNVSIQNIKYRRQGKIWGEGFNVALRSKLCCKILIYVINIMSNL